MDLFDKLQILTGAAKYDVACTSSGVDKNPHKEASQRRGMRNLHSFSADGRCISLLKVLMTNICIYDCKYCVNRRTNDIKRAAFTTP
jgi:predicted DNA-binding helix-hairpin-helix protein